MAKTFEELAEQIEALMADDVHEREVKLPNGAVLYVQRRIKPKE
jgi:hypothetical protein